MSAITASTSSQKSIGNITLDPRLQNLYSSLHNLPTTLPDHPDIYPFAEKFVLDRHDIEFYGSPQGALNHKLELVFGSRSMDSVVKFKGRGRSLEAIVYIFMKYIDGDDGENLLLWKWVTDLAHAAVQISTSQIESSHKQLLTNKPSKLPRRQRSSAKQQNKGKPRKMRKRRSEAAVSTSKEISAIRWPHNPADLQDYTRTNDPSGRDRDEFLDKLTIPCHSKLNESHLRVRCSGAGCWWSWAEPRATARIFNHAFWCNGLDTDLREEVQRRSAELSLAFKVQQQGEDIARSISPPTLEEIRQKEERVNHALLKYLCDRMIPPSAVDCLRWRQFVATLDENVKTASGSTIADNFVTTEAAFARKESVNLLSQSDNLTLSYDGGTTKGHESIYTVHATVPSTREAHLLDGNEASGVSHTTEHLCNLLDKHLKTIGPEKFSCIVSDNAGNTRAARTLIEQEYPWIIALQDACHHQSNTAKDIGQLLYFQPCIMKMKSVVTHFHTSSYAARHLSALCVLHNVSGGLVAVGNTRFASHFYAARSVLNCLPLILQLVSSEVLDLTPSSPIYWMLDRKSVDHFTTELRQLCTILEPIARSIKCLESSHSTPADVYLFWLAIVARLHDLFKNNSTINGAGLPKDVIEDITSIVNSRHQEMFQKQSGPIYLAAFYLDVRFRSSDVFLGYSTLSTRAQNTPIDLSSDSDIRRLLPAYTIAGSYLVKLLGRLYNKDPNSAPFSHYSSWSDVQAAFRRQLLSFTRGLSPFDQRHTGTQTAREYWETLLTAPSADLLATIGLLLASIVPNSMAEERTMSTITKLNSPDRASQKVSTLIDMVTIRQHYRREEAIMGSLPRSSARPSVRFADLTPAVRLLTADCSTSERNELTEGACPETNNLGDVVEPVSIGGRNYFEVEREEGVFLASKALFEALSDHPGASVKASRPLDTASYSEPIRKRQRVDIDSIIF